MAREFSTVGIVGVGTMGAGIAEVVARSGRRVIGVEIDAAGVERARAYLDHSTERAVAGGKLDAAGRTELLGRITLTTKLSDLADADVVLEAIPENLEDKEAVLAELDSVCRPEVIFASNTSSLSITEIGVHTGRPGKVEVYEGANHGWTVPGGGAYNEASAEKAWAELLAVYKRALV